MQINLVNDITSKTLLMIPVGVPPLGGFGVEVGPPKGGTPTRKAN
jgi:hypothetical protein